MSKGNSSEKIKFALKIKTKALIPNLDVCSNTYFDMSKFCAIYGF